MAIPAVTLTELMTEASQNMSEASFGYCVRPRDNDDWRTVVGKAMLWFSSCPKFIYIHCSVSFYIVDYTYSRIKFEYKYENG